MTPKCVRSGHTSRDGIPKAAMGRVQLPPRTARETEAGRWDLPHREPQCGAATGQPQDSHRLQAHLP